MADLRETMLAGFKAAIEVDQVDWHGEVTTRPAGLRAYRHLTRSVDVEQLPDFNVVYLGEGRTPLNRASTDVSERMVAVGVACRVVAADGESSDRALLPLLQWVEIAVLVDYTLGGVLANNELEGIDPIDAEEFTETMAGALMRFRPVLRTKWGDPRQAP